MKRLLIVALFAVVGATSAWASSIGGGAPDPWGNTIFVRGGFNGWADVDAMTWDGVSEYNAVLSIAAGTWEFKIADSGWANPDFGPTGDPNVTLGVPTDIGTAIGANFSLALADAGLYRFTLSDIAIDLQSGILTVTRVPVPAAILLFASALAGFGALRKKS